ncbi:MAG: decaprenyl-phosphate phosphoribosyltransferase [Comamonas sp.]|jgi:4-hydroxybenzoate polyprenyltransferase|nr:decaprenyl-phosphate phosphoribosyltransferase [Comamonas sp.]
MPPTPSSSSSRLQGLLRLMRPRQWIKNGFVLAPLVFTGSFTDQHAVLQALLAMLLFCVASSATYIVNDLRDIEQDRKHPRKSQSRPLAAGLVTLRQALLLLLVLYVLLLAAWPLAPQVLPVIAAYLVLNLAYSYYLKHQPVLDIFTIAIGFVLRVWGGAQALQVPISSWMFVTTLCLALYLAALKRRQELLQTGTEARAVLQKYSVSLVERYAEIAATGALLFYSMFVMSVRPQLVVSIPLVLFGLFRYWYVVEKLDGGESPTDALLSDLPLLLTVLAWVLVCLWALAGLKG